MSAGSSGAVFFLGTRAHYQILQHPETRSYDAENGNEETIYQNPSVREIWPEQDRKNTCASEKDNWNYCDQIDDTDDRLEIGNGVKRRTRRRQSETALCERDNDMKPALLNSITNPTPKTKPRRAAPLSFLARLARRRLVSRGQSPETALRCTYRDACRCLDCQSRYFECDESDGYTSDESVYTPHYVAPAVQPAEVSDDDDEVPYYIYFPDANKFPERFKNWVNLVDGKLETSSDYEYYKKKMVFVDTVPEDNTSTDLLIEGPQKMSVSSEETEDLSDESMHLEVAAGTPVLLNYLLTHPITCSIQ